MKMLREGESVSSIPIRGDRFFNLHNYWFFATREGAAVGPYDTKEHAIQGAQSFIEFARQADNSTMQLFTQGTRFGT